MRPDKKFVNKIKSRLDKKQNEMLRLPAVFGDAAGNVKLLNQPNFNYVTIGNNVSVVFNNRVPALAGVKIWVGYASEDQNSINGKTTPKRFQVLSTRSEAPSGGDTSVGGYAPASRYAWGGADPLAVEMRAFMPLRIGVSKSLGGMNVDLYRGYVKRFYIDRQNVDISAHVPTTENKAAFVLITIDDSGAVIQTKGVEVDIVDLDISDIPEKPSGTLFECGAVRVYYGQTVIQDGKTNTDFVDLRSLAYVSTSSGGGTFQRVLSSALTLLDGECLIISGYLNQSSYDLALNGDAELQIL